MVVSFVYFCFNYKVFRCWEHIHGHIFIRLVLDQKLLLMRIPTVELLQSLPLAFYMTMLCYMKQLTVREEGARWCRRSTKDYLDSTIFIPLRLFLTPPLLLSVCLSHSTLLTLSTLPPRIPNLLI